MKPPTTKNLERSSFLSPPTYWIAKHVCAALWRWNKGAIWGHLPPGPFMLVANHGSYLDWLLLDVILRREFGQDVVFVAKRKVTANPLWRALADYRNAIIVDDSSRHHAVAAVIKTFTAEHAPKIIGIFPEGTRSQNGEQTPAFRGAAWIARKLKVPIVPVALCGFWELWPPHQRLPSLRSGKLSIHILPPIDPQVFADDQTTIDFAMDKIYRVVSAHKRHDSEAHIPV